MGNANVQVYNFPSLNLVANLPIVFPISGLTSDFSGATLGYFQMGGGFIHVLPYKSSQTGNTMELYRQGSSGLAVRSNFTYSPVNFTFVVIPGEVQSTARLDAPTPEYFKDYRALCAYYGVPE